MAEGKWIRKLQSKIPREITKTSKETEAIFNNSLHMKCGRQPE